MFENTKALVLAIAALVGCSSNTEGGSTPSTPDEACTSYAETICAKYQSCSPLLVQASYGDIATCKTRTKIACVASLNAPSTGTTVDKAGPCISAYSSLACGDLFTGTQPTACQFVGTLGDGAACGDGGQCASGVCGNKTGHCGTCTKKNVVGDACTGSCNNNLACVSGKCATPAKAGEACGTTPCGSGLVCAAGKCTTPAKTGEACASDGTAPSCDAQAGLLCNPSTKKCQLVGFAAVGAACGYDTATTTYTACNNGAHCVLATGKSTGTCVAPAADGAACDASKGSQSCLPPALCISGKCTLPDYSTCK